MTVKNAPRQKSFVYSGANDQWLAAQHLGLSDDGNHDLQEELQQYLPSIDFSYHDPGLSYGIRINTVNYARFLREILSGDLEISSLLGSHTVPAKCFAIDCSAAQSPVKQQLNETWHYSLGHWVEDDDTTSDGDPKAPVHDGAFSSPGAYGYYPWIDASKTYYGILARRSLIDLQASKTSVQCGREMRAAWEHPSNYPAS